MQKIELIMKLNKKKEHLWEVPTIKKKKKKKNVLKVWFMGGWMDGWMGVKAVLRIAYSNQKFQKF